MLNYQRVIRVVALLSFSRGGLTPPVGKMLHVADCQGAFRGCPIDFRQTSSPSPFLSEIAMIIPNKHPKFGSITMYNFITRCKYAQLMFFEFTR